VIAVKSIYAFEDADSKNRMLLGGKGAGLSEMTGSNFLYLLDLQLQPKFATNITKTKNIFQKIS